MAEWSNAAVLKTVDLHGSGGSNPSSSAKGDLDGLLFFVPLRLCCNIDEYKKDPTGEWSLFNIFCSVKVTPWRLLICRFDVDLVVLGLLAVCTWVQVCSGDECSTFITLDLINPEFHC